MTFEKVTLVGANGTLGSPILQALLSANTFTVTVLSRSSSQATYPDSVHVKTIPDHTPTEKELFPLLHGQDALIDAFDGSRGDLHMRFADAAAHAGVQRFIPADFGSCDSSSPRALELLPSSFSWTSLICGHFFGYGLQGNLLLFDVTARAVQMLDGGDTTFSTSTLDTIGTAVVRILQAEDETRNRMLYIQTFCTTQNEIWRSLKTATGTSDAEWHVSHVTSEEYIDQQKAKLARDPKESDAMVALVGVLSIVEADWRKKDGFANELLGLPGADMDAVVREVVRSAEERSKM